MLYPLSPSKATHTFTKLFNDAATFALSATSTTQLKFIGLLKLRKHSRSAVRHLQERTVPKKKPELYLYISRYTSTVISKTKTDSWQKTCRNFLLKPVEVFSLLRSISGSSSFSPSSDLPNFPNRHTPVDCANQLFAHLQSHFSIKTPKFFRSSEKKQMNRIRST